MALGGTYHDAIYTGLLPYRLCYNDCDLSGSSHRIFQTLKERMMLVLSVKEQVTQALDTLSDDELQQVAEYVSFLRFRARAVPPLIVDTTELAALYAEFADEDRALAEDGLEGYRDHLHDEDAQ